MIFWPSPLRRKKNVEKSLVFRPEKLHQKKFVETTRMFQPAKLHQNKHLETYVDFSIGEITLKKYVEMPPKFLDIWFLKYQCNIDIEFMLIQREAPVGCVTRSLSLIIMEEGKLLGIANRIFQVSYFLRLFLMSFKYAIILLRDFSTNSVFFLSSYLSYSM